MALVARAWGTEVLRDSARMMFQFFFRLEVEGLENIPGAGERVVIAPNHVSLLDGPLLHAILPKQAAFAVNSQMGETWWVRPFLRHIRAHLLEPTKPLATRTLVNALKAGEMIVIFPEGRITVTGGLMKAYDGAAMIADKAGAWIVPARIEGAERSALGYLRPTQVRKALFPKIKVTFLPPRKLTVDPALKGKTRRQAAGLALQDIMVDAAVATARFDRTLFEALVEARETRDTGRPALSDPLGVKLSYRKLVLGAQVLGAKLEPLAPVGGAVGLMLPNSAGVAVAFFALQGIGRVPAMINFTSGAANIKAGCRAAGVTAILTSRVFVSKAPPDGSRRRARQGPAHRLSGGRPRHGRPARQGRRHPGRGPPARCPHAERSGRHPLHVGLRGRAQGRRAVASQRARQLRAVPHPHRRQRRGHRVQRAARVPLLRADRRPHHAAARRRAGLPLSHRRCTTASCRSSSTTTPPPSCSAPTRSCAATRAPRTLTTSARCA